MDGRGEGPTDVGGDRRSVLWTAAAVAGAVSLLVAVCCSAGAVAVFVAWLDEEDARRAASESPPASAALPLPLGRETSATIDAERPRARFELEVPEVAVALRFWISCEGGPVHADLAFDPPDDEDPVWDAASPDSSDSMTWTVSLADTPSFAGGRALLEVHPDEESDSPQPGRPWRVKVLAAPVGPPEPVPLAVGVSAASVVSDTTGWFRTFTLPASAARAPLRLDLVSEQCDLDLLVAFGEAAFVAEDAAARSVTCAAVETLLLGGDGASRPEPAEAIFVTVLDPECGAEPSAFRLFATEGTEAPAELREVPALPLPADERERAMVTVVEVVAGEGIGSGVLVSEDGHVLTARHVVEEARGPDAAGGPGPGDIVLAASPDVRVPARSLFRARVVAWDEASDVALLRIDSGVFGQPLPEGYRFPAALPAPERPHLGETLTTVGYPRLDGDPARNPVTASRGILAAWTAGRVPQLGRTDAFVAGGSSGGSVLDTKGRLVGIVLEGHSETDGGQRLSAFLPIDGVPKEIREKLGW